MDKVIIADTENDAIVDVINEEDKHHIKIQAIDVGSTIVKLKDNKDKSMSL